jgi:integrase
MKRAPKNKRGPVDVVEGKGVRIPIYSGEIRGVTSYQFPYYLNGIRRRERASTLDGARARARELVEELATGVAHVAAFTPKETAAINEAVEILRPLGVPLTEAVRQFAFARKRLNGEGEIAEAVNFYLAHKAEAKLPEIRIPDLVEKLLGDLRNKEKSRRYVLDMQARLNRAAEHFRGNIGGVRASQIDDWLDSRKGASGRTKNNYRTALITLFSFARQKGYLARGQETEAEFSARHDDKGGEIGIYTPEQLEIFLTRIDPRFVPFVAIGAFAGLRSAEIVRLEWPEIRFEQDVVEIKAAKAKTASRRLVPITPALRAWLEPFRQKEGRVLQRVPDEFALAKNFRKAVGEIKDKNGKALLKIVHNGLRHSFITYRMAIVKNAGEVALEAGNSPRMIFEHYRELATADEAEKWFARRPSEARKRLFSEWIASLPNDPSK